MKTSGTGKKKGLIDPLFIDIRGEFNKFVELGIFLHNSRFLFSFLCSVNLCQLNDNSCSVNTYIFCSYFLFENLYL